MKNKFEELIKNTNSSDRVKLLDFTNKVPELMSISDFVVTKPGGLTSTESLVSMLPMIIINPIPGQEEENAEFLLKNNMAVKIGKGSNCKSIIEELLKNKNSLFSMKKSCESFDKSKSNENIYNLVKQLTEKDS